MVNGVSFVCFFTLPTLLEYLGFVLGSCTSPLICDYVIQVDQQDKVAFQLWHSYFQTLLLTNQELIPPLLC